MRVEFRAGKYSEIACDLLAFPVFEGEKPGSRALAPLERATRGLVSAVLSSGEFKTEPCSTCLIHRPPRLKASRLLLVGAGKKATFHIAEQRKICATLVRVARSSGCRRVALLLRDGPVENDTVRACVEGAHYGSYDSEAYKTRDRRNGEIESLLLIGSTRRPAADFQDAVFRGETVGEATNLARILVDEPANILTPKEFAGRASTEAERAGLQVEILEREDLERMGMNTLLAVSRGSEEPPKLITLKIPGRDTKARKGSPLFALVGKGVTFDSGGISLKPAERMEEMKADMAGAAAVLGAMTALARLRTRRRVLGIIPAVENLPSGKAARPGDVVKSLSGKTVEIINTDAEGRLILADALTYARRLGATNLVDIATLTGACVIALGMVRAGMMGTDVATMDRLRKNCDLTGEKVWQLPLDEEYRLPLRSNIADIRNVGNRWAGAITAAKFLQEFVEDTPWVHLDIAGMDLDTEGHPYSSKGATGFGVRTLVQLLS